MFCCTEACVKSNCELIKCAFGLNITIENGCQKCSCNVANLTEHCISDISQCKCVVGIPTIINDAGDSNCSRCSCENPCQVLV